MNHFDFPHQSVSQSIHHLKEDGTILAIVKKTNSSDESIKTLLKQANIDNPLFFFQHCGLTLLERKNIPDTSLEIIILKKNNDFQLDYSWERLPENEPTIEIEKKSFIKKAIHIGKKIIKSNKITHEMAKVAKGFIIEGIKPTIKKHLKKIKYKIEIRMIFSKHFTIQKLKEQQQTVFDENITFSILVPLYNTPIKFLHEMIHSVQRQTYKNWELCLADGSDSNHSYIEDICRKYAEEDQRIHYKKLEKNMGISGNTNACIEMSTGDYISLFDHDDILHPSALYEKMRVISDKHPDLIYTDENTFRNHPSDAFCPHFKPDYAPDTLRANNYICHFTSIKRELLQKVGGFRPEFDGSQDYDMMLRLTEKAESIVHIPQILYYWRAHAQSVADNIGAKPYVIDAAKRAIKEHLNRVGLEGEVLDSQAMSMYRLKYNIEGNPLVSIIIPSYEHVSILKNCIESIYRKTTYQNFEIIIVENNSASPEIFRYYKEIQEKWSNLHVIYWDSYFNYSAINNFAVKYASGQHLLLLNNDTEIISPDWIQEMLMYSQREDVGAVGAKLYYPDNTIQHAGVVLGIYTLAGHIHREFKRSDLGYMGRLSYTQNLSIVTFACVMISRNAWNAVNGLDETFEVAFNDVDMCMRLRKAGYLNIWTPFAELYHYESKSRGTDNDPVKRERFVGEVERCQKRWAKELAAGDPYYNPNFSLDREDFTPLIG
ncbi:MAG: glycosyltransferase [Erysipelotrichaceae bacterium]|nr:glycosyltransferase [Erysipelotrichaceae bacterium]